MFRQRYLRKFIDVAITSLDATDDSIKAKDLYATLKQYDLTFDRFDTIFVQNVEDVDSLVKQAKESYQAVFMKLLAKVKPGKLMKEIVKDIPSKILPNFSQPLFLSDFLLDRLDDKSDIEVRILALKALFILLSKHGLDSPEYYTKLYNLLTVQTIAGEDCNEVKSVFEMDIETKSRFFRVLDLSLRSTALPSKLIAAFMKRVGYLMVSGAIWQTNDLLFGLSLIANLAKRHPRTLKLLTRNRLSLKLGIKLEADPYLHEEKNPLKSKALQSSLWEVEILAK